MSYQAPPSTMMPDVSASRSFSVRKLFATWQKTYAVIFAVFTALGATFFAAKTGLAHGEGMTILATAWIGFAAVIYAAFSKHNQRGVGIVLISEAVAIGFLIVLQDTTAPLDGFIFWSVGALLSGFVHQAGAKRTFTRGDAMFFTVQTAAVLVFGGACLLQTGSLQSWLFVVAAALRLGVFPSHVVLMRHLEQATFCGRISYLVTAFMSLAVWAAYVPTISQSLAISESLAYALLAAGVFFAMTGVGQTKFTRVTFFALFGSLSIALFAFTMADSTEQLDVAWLLATNSVIAASALFLCDEILVRRFGGSDYRILQGVATSMPWLSGYALIAALEFGNSPITWGFEGGEELILTVFNTSPVAGCLAVVGWGTLLFGLIKTYARLFWGPSKQIPGIDLTVAERCALFVLVVLVIFPVWHMT